jgi:subtilisin family serine protease
MLDSAGVTYRPHWLINTIHVQSGSQILVEALAARPDVRRIRQESTMEIPEPKPGILENTVDGVEWGIASIRADQAWADFGVQGEGIVVANIDTGAQFDHPALVAQYRGNLGSNQFDHNYNWHDPNSTCQEPCDTNNHGTHTMGTMVGDDGAGNQIGVAPAARWIAARGCTTSSCSDTDLLSCGEWITAPTDLNGENPDPSRRPHIVNNSWGGGSNDSWYQGIVDGWVAAGIFPAFSNGNSGSSCSTSGSPGDYPNSYSSGAYDSGNAIASFSSRGPSDFNDEIKPNISSPGVNIRSSIPGDGYDSYQGTSMASPHTAGAVALMWSAAPALLGDIDYTATIMDQTAIDMDDTTCGGTAGDNNTWGEGRMDVYAAIQNSPTGPTGTMAGVVTDGASGAAVSGAMVQVSGEADRNTFTGADGAYSMPLPVGSYDAQVSAYGYQVSSATGLSITENQTTTQDFALVPVPSHVVSGTVSDSDGNPVANARSGFPLPGFPDPEPGR